LPDEFEIADPDRDLPAVSRKKFPRTSAWPGCLPVISTHRDGAQTGAPL
jgi:hypothetical protein